MSVKEMDGLDEELYQNMLRNAMMVTKFSNELPNNGSEWDYYQSFPAFSKLMKDFNSRLINLTSKIYNYHGITGKVQKLDLEEQVEYFFDGNDVLLERINIALDEASGVVKQADTVIVELSTKGVTTSASWNRHINKSSQPTYKLLAGKNVVRPQLKFKEKVNNKPEPFVPKIKEKPHSMKPLAILLELNEFGEEEYSHPYEFELERFQPKSRHLEVDDETPLHKSLEETPLIMVNSQASLGIMMADLSNQTEIAVDLEAHSYRTFQGITCLIQISSHSSDYIIDPFEVWEHLHCLNEVFCNPNIVKIFHGAEKDVEWLQRDFGVYLVNLFDTYQAAKLMSFSQLSLAYLIRHYCHITINKQFQLADWRIRPLPEEMVRYAREDTHYLIYIYKKLKADLRNRGVGNNLLTAVWENSRQTCLRRYSVPRIHEDSHLELYRHSKRSFNNRQLYALKEIFQWRDKIAREEDESLGYVLPKHMMLQIAEILPREMQGILACCNPIPPLIRQHLLTLHNIILKARELPLTSVQDEGNPLVAPKPIVTSFDQDMEESLHCPHDMSHLHDIRDDLPTLLGNSHLLHETLQVPVLDEMNSDIGVILKDEPKIKVFAKRNAPLSSKNLAVNFTTPYVRYCRAKAVEKSAAATAALEDKERMEKVRQHFFQSLGTSATTEIIERVEEKIAEALESLQKTELTKKQKGKKRKQLQKKDPEPVAKLMNKKPRKPKKRKITAKEINGSTSTDAVSKLPSAQEEKTITATRSDQASSSHVTNPEQRFTPFDYSQVNYQEFQAVSTKRPPAQRGGKAKNRSKFHNKRGNKSMTYGSQKR